MTGHCCLNKMTAKYKYDKMHQCLLNVVLIIKYTSYEVGKWSIVAFFPAPPTLFDFLTKPNREPTL